MKASGWIPLLPYLLLSASTDAQVRAGGPEQLLLRSGQTWPLASPSARKSVSAPALNGVVALRGAIRGGRIGPVTISGAYRAIETSKTASVSDLVVDGLMGHVQRECYRVRGDRITIRNVHCDMIDGPQKSPNLPEGLHIEAGSDILVERSSFKGFQMTIPGNRYWNGDGIAAERDVSGLTIRDVVADDNTDAGFDIKPPVKMDQVSASGNCRNFRLWSDSEIGTMTVGNSIKRGPKTTCAGLWVKGDATAQPVVRVRKLVVRMTKPGDIIRIEEGPANLTIDECDIQAPPGSTLIVAVSKAGKVQLGRGCRV